MVYPAHVRRYPRKERWAELNLLCRILSPNSSSSSGFHPFSSTVLRFLCISRTAVDGTEKQKKTMIITAKETAWSLLLYQPLSDLSKLWIWHSRHLRSRREKHSLSHRLVFIQTDWLSCFRLCLSEILHRHGDLVQQCIGHQLMCSTFCTGLLGNGTECVDQWSSRQGTSTTTMEIDPLKITLSIVRLSSWECHCSCEDLWHRRFPVRV